MSYAAEREYTPTERAVIVTGFLLQHGCITSKDIMRLTGLSLRRSQEIMLLIERVLNVRREGNRLLYEGKE